MGFDFNQYKNEKLSTLRVFVNNYSLNKNIKQGSNQGAL